MNEVDVIQAITAEIDKHGTRSSPSILATAIVENQRPKEKYDSTDPFAAFQI
jgi:hypothetical protein